MGSHRKDRKILVDVLGSSRKVRPRVSGSVRCSPARTAAWMRWRDDWTLPGADEARASFQLLSSSQPIIPAVSTRRSTRGHRDPTNMRVR
eukprot:3375226-Prymnesium_polylepis.2